MLAKAGPLRHLNDLGCMWLCENHSSRTMRAQPQARPVGEYRSSQKWFSASFWRFLGNAKLLSDRIMRVAGS
jgi:hypothetical protein